MPINVQQDSLFKPGYCIKYITGWDQLFKPEKDSGQLRFYNGTSLFLVDVMIRADRDKLTYEDIYITTGEYHNSKDITDRIRQNEKVIYEVCKMSPIMGFVFDLQKLKIVEDDDFKEQLPKHGLNTMFLFENVLDSPYYCLVNPARNIRDNEFYAWLMSYIYSYSVCLSARGKVEHYPKMFLQAISLLAANDGNRNAVKISNRATVLDCDLSDCGELLLPIPGENTKRFEELVSKSLEQMTSKGGKKK